MIITLSLFIFQNRYRLQIQSLNCSLYFDTVTFLSGLYTIYANVPCAKRDSRFELMFRLAK